ncbi:MAG: MerC domain-containing protein [Proteobacteria bacterium]|nr:MerC domain-containing protein [Pseudomonadota bacterium]
MRAAMFSIRDRLDRIGVLLSGLCAVHCLASLVLVAGLGLGGEYLLNPAIHQVGLALAAAVGAATLVMGVIRHRDPLPLHAGAAGIALMTVALFTGHGRAEAVLTICGVALLAFAHFRNLRYNTCAA